MAENCNNMHFSGPVKTAYSLLSGIRVILIGLFLKREDFASFLELFYNSFYFCCPFGKRTQLPKWHFVLILEKFQHFCEMWLSAKLDIFRLHFPFCPMFIFLQTFPNLAPIFISLTLMHHAEWFKTWAI